MSDAAAGPRRARCRGGLGRGARGAARLGGRGRARRGASSSRRCCAPRAAGATRSATRRTRPLPRDALDVSTDPFAARDIAQTTDAGEHRPLKTVAEPAGRLGAGGARRARALDALDYLYPACAAHWYAGRTGTLRVTHWRETAGRQSGMYSPVRLLPDDARAEHGARLLRRRRVPAPRGVGDRRGPHPLPTTSADEGPPAGDAAVPCPEACSMFISFARKVLTLERSAPRREMPGLGPMSAAELEQLRDVVAAAAAGTLGAVREGEFDEPTNPRRVRYLAARLAEAAADGRPTWRRSSPARGARAPRPAPRARWPPEPPSAETHDPRDPGHRALLERSPAGSSARATGQPPIRGDLRAPRGPAARTAVVICHGLKGFRTGASSPRLARALARARARRGHLQLLPQRRGRPRGDFTDAGAVRASNTHSRDVDEIRMVLDARHGRLALPAARRAHRPARPLARAAARRSWPPPRTRGSTRW